MNTTTQPITVDESEWTATEYGNLSAECGATNLMNKEQSPTGNAQADNGEIL
jgi:hypothetical protein